jgi:hypothetical protein
MFYWSCLCLQFCFLCSTLYIVLSASVNIFIGIYIILSHMGSSFEMLFLFDYIHHLRPILTKISDIQNQCEKKRDTFNYAIILCQMDRVLLITNFYNAMCASTRTLMIAHFLTNILSMLDAHKGEVKALCAIFFYYLQLGLWSI